MRPIDADHVLHEIEELKKSPWFNRGKSIDGTNAFNNLQHTGYIERKEAVEAVRDLCIRSEPTISSWISVEERLPDRDVTVLAIKQLKNGSVDYCLARCIPDWDYTNCATGETGKRPYWICAGNNNIIYWSPLPEMPEECHDQR